MQLNIPARRSSILLSFQLLSLEAQKIRIYAYDQERPKTTYTDRKINLSAGQTRALQLRFPTSPEQLVVKIVNANGDDISVRSLKLFGERILPLHPCSRIKMDNTTRAFISFALDFAKQCSYMPTGTLQSKDGRFTFKYLRTITNQSGQPINTPARISHNSGVIEIAQDKFANYTVPMRLIILLHEYAHKWLNRQNGNRIDDEVAADLNALKIYLALGYPHIDARLVFCYVFYNKQSPQNDERLQILEKFITDFENGKIIPLCR